MISSSSRGREVLRMGMAKMAKAPVLLVGDIDRGGVFAQLIGTVMLLDEDERDLVKGLIVNKFRGDRAILDPGLVLLEEKAGVPVVGVAPYLHIQVEDEDSLTERFEGGGRPVDLIDIAVVRLPRISNFTDFDPFESIPGVSLRYVRNVSELKDPDMVILPGTKNTMEDLRWLRQSGMEAAILKLAGKGRIIMGVCGGYQMLGTSLSDPEGVEAGGSMRGMGLLQMDTVFSSKKTRTQVEGVFTQMGGALGALQGVGFSGYEIHMGEPVFAGDTHGLDQVTDRVTGTTKQDGACSGNVYGTYVHGIFDREAVAKGIVSAIGRAKGLDVSEIQAVDFAAFKETQYDLLADGLRSSLDMERIYQILEEGVGER